METSLSEKICARCKLSKSINEFYRLGANGRQPYCKDCNRLNTADWKKNNPERLRQAMKERHEKNPEKNRSRWRRWAKTRDPIEVKKVSRRNSLKVYGLTEEDYSRMLEAQNGGCAICGAERADSTKRNLCVDHNHATGEVRGLLCTACNHVIGRFEDDASRLRRAAEYVERNGHEQSKVQYMSKI